CSLRYFCFQAEDGIRDRNVTGVQTCALPILSEQQTDLDSKKINLNIITPRGVKFQEQADTLIMRAIDGDLGVLAGHEPVSAVLRSEERRVGKECAGCRRKIG